MASVMKRLAKKVRPGVSTQDIDELAEKLINKAGAEPSFKNYRGYPKVACISVNEEVVHNIPSDDKIVQKGDIVGLDLGLRYEGLYTDMAMTVPAGRISKQAKKLIKVTRKALEIGLKQVKAGHTIGDIGYTIEKFVVKHGFSVVRTLTGHGVGKEVHEDPKIPNFGEKGKGFKLQEDMTLAIEPMVNIGSHEVMTKEDGWGIVTEDSSLSAHFEHTVLVTKRGCEILTK